jgi:hypothetical protein
MARQGFTVAIKRVYDQPGLAQRGRAERGSVERVCADLRQDGPTPSPLPLL